MTLTPPLTTRGRYQYAVFGALDDPDVARQSERLRYALTAAMDALGVNPRKFLIDVSGEDAMIDRRLPSIGIFFGFRHDPVVSADAAAKIGLLASDGRPIIPVVATTDGFSRFVPSALAGFNGLPVAQCGTGLERLAARVMEGFGLLRQKRRLFISYRRNESSGVATQLYEALTLAGFDVFLDTSGAIRPGDAFQDVLWHRLADTDVVVLLDTPGFLESRWTEAELARANTANIQILQVLWPGQSEGAAAAFSTFHQLSSDHFQEEPVLGPAAQLEGDEIEAIIDEVEGLRARAYAARHNFLVREFLLAANDQGIRVRSRLDSNLVVTAPDGGKILVMAAVGVPDSERYEVMHKAVTGGDGDGDGAYAGKPVLLYDHTGIQPHWLAHLAWLDANLLNARSVSMTGMRAWLGSLKEGGR